MSPSKCSKAGPCRACRECVRGADMWHAGGCSLEGRVTAEGDICSGSVNVMRRSCRLLVDASQAPWWLSVVVLLSEGYVWFTLKRDPIPVEGRVHFVSTQRNRGEIAVVMRRAGSVMDDAI